jgi:hypothetical protein
MTTRSEREAALKAWLRENPDAHESDAEHFVPDEMPADEKSYRAMWLWLSEHPEMDRPDWPGLEKEPPDRLRRLERGNYCYACLVAEERRSDKTLSKCWFCPVYQHATSPCRDGVYRRWRHPPDGSLEERSAAARKLANLPWFHQEKQ